MGFTFQVPTIVGGTVLVIEQIESQNFVTGVSGWAIAADGTAEFANLTARGTLVGGQVVINGPDYPNSIALYTNNAGEVEPATIQPTGSGGSTAGILQLNSPKLQPSITPPAQITLNGFNDGHGLIEMDTDDVRMTAADAVTIESGASLRMTNDFASYVNLNAGNWQIEGETWHTVGAAGEPPFLGNWAVSGGVPVAFTKDATGRVQLRGRGVEAVASSTTIFVLPVGCRPSQTMSFPVKSNNDGGTISWLAVTTAGAITLLGNVVQGRVQTILDSVSFPTF